MAQTVILDFDGVIKDSLEAKADAFCSLFKNVDAELLDTIRTHHLLNGGVSRHQKLPFYINLAGMDPDESTLRGMLRQLSMIMTEQVLNSEWVPGARQFILENPFNQNLYIASAMPIEELAEICSRSNLAPCIKDIYGGDTRKHDACRDIMRREGATFANSVFIGDSLSDYRSAKEAQIQFILRRHKLNRSLLKPLVDWSIDDFLPILTIQSQLP